LHNNPIMQRRIHAPPAVERAIRSGIVNQGIQVSILPHPRIQGRAAYEIERPEPIVYLMPASSYSINIYNNSNPHEGGQVEVTMDARLAAAHHSPYTCGVLEQGDRLHMLTLPGGSMRLDAACIFTGALAEERVQIRFIPLLDDGTPYEAAVVHFFITLKSLAARMQQLEQQQDSIDSSDSDEE
jgi:hypothetical protein